MKMFVISWNVISETTIVNCFSKAGFSESLTDEEDDPFSQLKESTNQLQLRDQELVTYLNKQVNHVCIYNYFTAILKL